MGFLDRLQKALAVPHAISAFDLEQAEADAAAYALAEQEEQQSKSVEQLVREQLEVWKKTAPEAANLDFLDPTVVLPPELQGDAHPTTSFALSFQILRQMARLPVPMVVINKRITQIAPFTRRLRSPNEPGYKVHMRDRKRPPSTNAVKMIAALEAWIETCGDPSQQEDPSFKAFTSKYLYDSLSLDWACAEILVDKRGFPAAMIPADAATIRKAAVPERQYAKGQRDPRGNGYVQVMHNRVMAEWPTDRMMCMIRRPRTDIQLNGYGTPELDEIARYVNYLMQAEFYNASNFTNGMHAAGMIAVMSSMNARTFANLDQRLRQMMTGAHNAHRMILLQLDPKEKEDIKPIQFTQTNKEMEFGQWIGWLLKMFCSAYNMDPAEVNFLFGNEGQRASFTTADPEERVSQSKEQGLSVLLSDYASVLNRSIIQRIDPDFELAFEGLDVRNPLTQSQLDQQAVQNWASVNEIRATRDLPPLKHWVFDVPLSSVVVSTISQEKQRQEEQQMQAQQPQEPADAPEELQGYEDAQNNPEDPRSALPPGVDLKQLLSGTPPNGAGEALAKALTEDQVPVIRLEVQA